MVNKSEFDMQIGIIDRLDRIEGKLDKLIPVVRDVSKYLAEAKELANKGKKPRKQPKKRFITKENVKEEIRKTKEVLNS